MPKRTNKTNHVLNLLISGNEIKSNDPPSDTQPAADPQTVGPQSAAPQSAAPQSAAPQSAAPQTIAPQSAIPQNAVPQLTSSQAGIRIVESSHSANHPIANAIKASLEQEAIQMGISPEALAAPQQAEAAAEVKTAEEPDYQFVNVMEVVVKENLLDYMERFDVCTCRRCQADVTALALTYLPAKYIVTPKESLSPLLNFFSSKYKVPVMTELTKSCLQVLANPRH